MAVLASHSVAAYSEALQQHILGTTNALQNILLNTHKTDKYHYPTDFSESHVRAAHEIYADLLHLPLAREIVPKPFHSHNDYWRDVPFYTGLSYGAISTEADVWLINGTLHVCTLEMKAMTRNIMKASSCLSRSRCEQA